MLKEIYIGLMSGTSMDAIDAILIDFSKKSPKTLATHTETMPAELKSELMALTSNKLINLSSLGKTDIELARLFAKASTALVEKSSVSFRDIKAIGSHGQTIYHQPYNETSFTVQIGDPNTLTALTGITTVADFRRRDLALGGQGAPLVPAFHQELFQDTLNTRIILNIGGIANITILPSNQKKAIIGFDTGPGNTLLDRWAEKHLGKAFDNSGKWAASGKINKDLLDTLLQDSYFKRASPKSTGTDYFNEQWLETSLASFKDLKPEDVQATLVELTAVSIIEAINKHRTQRTDIFVCGGGIHNTYLQKRLAAQSDQYEIHSTAALGLDPDWVEAAAFAWLAKQTLQGKTGNVPSVTGAARATVLGGIYPA